MTIRCIVRDMREYTARVIRCAITSLQRFGKGDVVARRCQLDLVRRWIVDEIELIQIREKHLEGASLYAFAEEVMRSARGSRTKVLLNSRLDIALACGAHGVHLPTTAGSLSPAQVRLGFGRAGLPPPMVSISCHTQAEVENAALAGVDLVLFGPVFEKRVEGTVVQEGRGLPALRNAVRVAGQVPLLALGGVTRASLGACLSAGAAGVAGIRLFAEG